MNLEKMILSARAKSCGRWFKGSLHNHTVRSNGRNTSPAEAREIYESAGYDFIALTDHDRRFPSLPWREIDWNVDTPGKFVILRGYEASHPLGHINCIGCLPQDVPVAPSDKRFIDAVNATGALTFLNHPSAFNDKPEEFYANAELKNIMGIEVYSGSRARKKAENNEDGHLGLYTKLWDEALSGGMKRRLLIAKALVHNPEVLVLDEPTAGVDVELRRSLWKYMKQLNKEGLTILLTTHYLEEAEQLCERTAIIHKGKLVALDKTAELTKEKKLEDVFVELTYQSDGLEKEPPPNKRSHG